MAERQIRGGDLKWRGSTSLWFAVPEDQKLVAGIFIALAYGLLGSPLLVLLSR
jgi:hypothetical protein